VSGPIGWSTAAGLRVAGVLVAFLAPALLQAQDLRLEIDSLRTPASPAFVLMGVAPVAIERPSTLRAIAISAVSSLHASGGVIPDDYAIEVAPYWLRSRASVTFDALRSGGPLSTAARTLGLSLATMQYEQETDAEQVLRGTRVGAGIRFLFFDGTPSSRIEVLSDSLRALHTQCILLPEPADEACIEEIGTREVALEIQREARDLDGFVLEMASALIGDFPNDVFELGRIDRVGIWVTPGLRLADSDLEVLAVARYMHERRGQGADVFDAGGRIGWAGSRFALAAEAVQRHASFDGESETRYRMTGTVEARLGESLLASFTFGKGYEPAESDPAGRDRIVATLGIGFGAGARPTLAIPLAGSR
jgi:hypothetical protein